MTKKQNQPIPKKLFVGFNWKMNPLTLFDAKKLFDIYTLASFQRADRGLVGLQPVLFVPSLFLTYLQSHNPSNLAVGSQDLSDQESGAFTGQLSGQMLSSIDCKYTLVAHSETRRDFKLKDRVIKNKILQALTNNITPIICMSFNNLENAKKELLLKLEATFDNELVEAIKVKAKSNFGSRQQPIFIIALEPIASIGTGQILDNKEIEKQLSTIDKFLQSHNLNKSIDTITGDQNGDYINLYGGSVNKDNINQIRECSNVDGFLLGGSSLIEEQVKGIFEIICN
jgi:triosephosphate isomerase (TIM)